MDDNKDIKSFGDLMRSVNDFIALRSCLSVMNNDKWPYKIPPYIVAAWIDYFYTVDEFVGELDSLTIANMGLNSNSLREILNHIPRKKDFR